MKKSNILAFALAFTLALAGSAGAADVTVAPGLVTWKAQDHETVLRVSGPDGSVQDLTFGPGETPSLGLFDKAGDVLKDGQYNWEILVNAALPEDTAEKLGALRAQGVDAGPSPAPARKLSGAFKVWNGDFVVPSAAVESVEKDQVILDDLIVDGSICAGLDCVNGESFGFDTLRLKENNLRIKAQDTSNSASFPSNDWQITFNDSSNGGQNKFSIDDIDGGRVPFTIEAGTPSHSLYLDSTGRIGFGTSTPVARLHVVDGNTPTLRLEQDGSSGFTPQTWDVAGNEAGFFVRDASNGSTLPFRVLPNAPSQALVVAGGGNIGIGAGTSPAAKFHIENTSGQDTDDFVVTSSGAVGIGTTAPATPLEIETTGDNTGRMRFEETATGQAWEMGGGTGNAFVILDPSDAAEFTLNAGGTLTIAGGLITGTAGTCTVGVPCDGVFSPEYEVESIEEHAEFMWENSYLKGVGPTPDGASQINLTQKTGGILHELEKAHIYIEQLSDTIKELSARLEQLEAAKSEE